MTNPTNMQARQLIINQESRARLELGLEEQTCYSSEKNRNNKSMDSINQVMNRARTELGAIPDDNFRLKATEASRTYEKAGKVNTKTEVDTGTEVDTLVAVHAAVAETHLFPIVSENRALFLTNMRDQELSEPKVGLGSEEILPPADQRKKHMMTVLNLIAKDVAID